MAGASEGHCRLVAEDLAAEHDVTIVTTCARDHITWRNHYPPGESRLEPVSPKRGEREGGLRVLRFSVARERQLHRFMALSDRVFADRSSASDWEQGFRWNRPDAPER